MEQEFKTVINSKHRLFDLHIKETLRYKDLIFLFVKRDFISLYKQTILGPLWAIIQPLLTTLVFWVIFGTLARLTTADIAGDIIIPSFLFYMSGNICWSYFSTTVTATSNTFISNRPIMTKVYYPRIASPIATSISGLISFGIQFAMFTIVWAIHLIVGGTDMSISFYLLFLPLIILQLMMLASGFGIIVSAVTTKYRDLAMLVSFALQLWQYASPIAYGLTLISESHAELMWLYMLNPVTPIITTFRYAMFGVGYFNVGFYLMGWGITLVIFLLGVILFSRIERTFADTI